MLRSAIAAANNLSIPSLVLKSPAFGGPEVPFGSIRITGWIYSVVVLWVVVRLARRPVATAYEPLAWLAILGLTALRSPFLPTYGAFPGAWLGALLLAICWTDARRWWTALRAMGDSPADFGGTGADSDVGVLPRSRRCRPRRWWGWRRSAIRVGRKAASLDSSLQGQGKEWPSGTSVLT